MHRSNAKAQCAGIAVSSIKWDRDGLLELRVSDASLTYERLGQAAAVELPSTRIVPLLRPPCCPSLNVAATRE